MVVLECPRCSTHVEERPGVPTVCPNCGFAGDAPAGGGPSGGTPSPGAGPYGGGYSASPYGATPYGGGGYAAPPGPVPQPVAATAYGHPQAHGHVQPTNGMAIAALVTGIIGIFFQVAAVLAIIFGVIGRKQCKERNEKGEGMALTGIVLGSVTLAITLFFFLFIFSLFSSW